MIVVDASVLADALADDGADGERARSILRGGGDLAAPDLVDVETVAVLRRRWLRGGVSAARFAAAVDDLEDLPLDRYPTLPLMRRAYELRENATVYDASYIALAELIAAPLVTADKAIAAVPGIRCVVELVTS